MNSIEIKGWRKDPTIAAIVAATFPEYRRRVVYVKAATSITLTDLNWGGGTRAEYRACTVQGEAVGSADRFSACVPWNNPAEGLEVPIPPGMIVVSGGIFCGKDSALRIHVNPADMPRYLEDRK